MGLRGLCQIPCGAAASTPGQCVRGKPPSLKSWTDPATYSMLSGSVLLERGGQGNRWHHGHGFPLLGFLPNVDRLCRKRLEAGPEAGEQVALVVHWSHLSNHSDAVADCLTGSDVYLLLLSDPDRGIMYDLMGKCDTLVCLYPISAQPLAAKAQWLVHQQGRQDHVTCSLYIFFSSQNTDAIYTMTWVSAAYEEERAWQPCFIFLSLFYPTI